MSPSYSPATIFSIPIPADNFACIYSYIKAFITYVLCFFFRLSIPFMDYVVLCNSSTPFSLLFLLPRMVVTIHYWCYFPSLGHHRRCRWGLERRGALEHWFLFQKIQVWFPASTQRLTTIYDSSPRGSEAFFWPPGVRVVLKHACRQNAHVHKQNQRVLLNWTTNISFQISHVCYWGRLGCINQCCTDLIETLGMFSFSLYSWWPSAKLVVFLIERTLQHLL